MHPFRALGMHMKTTLILLVLCTVSVGTYARGGEAAVGTAAQEATPTAHHYIELTALNVAGPHDRARLVEIAEGAAKTPNQAEHGVKPSGRTEKLFGDHAKGDKKWAQ